MPDTAPIHPDLLTNLRDPKAIQDAGGAGDPGRLTLVHGCWLVSADTGYKYPIRDGIPVMLIEEGARWKDTPIDRLPVPPPAPEPPPLSTRANPTQIGAPPLNPFRLAAMLIVGALLALLLVVTLRRFFARDEAADQP
jgi:uncharacterized protein YbaR (Trm112 family)